MLLVTHDTEECFALADEMVVMRDGRAVQSGTPRKSFRAAGQCGCGAIARPLQYSAGGDPLARSRPQCQPPALSGFRIGRTLFPGRLIGDQVWLFVRPDQLSVAPRNGRPAFNQIPATLLRTVEKPERLRLEFSGDIAVEVQAGAPFGSMDQCSNVKEWVVEFPSAGLRIL